MFRRGYRGNIEIGNYAVFGKDKVGGLAQLTTTQGYSFGDGAFVGAGLGAGVDLNGSLYFPLFLDAKYNFLDRRTSPFAAVRTGLRYSPDEEYISFNIALGGGAAALRRAEQHLLGEARGRADDPRRGAGAAL